MAKTFRFSLPINGLDNFEAELHPVSWNGFPVPLVAHDYAAQIAEAVGDPIPAPYAGLQPYDGIAWEILTGCPKCGSAVFGVGQFSWNTQPYDASTDTWGDADFADCEDYPQTALCHTCEHDCTHVLERAEVADFFDEPTWTARTDAPGTVTRDLAEWLRDSARSRLLFGCHDEPLDDAGVRVVRAILARLEADAPTSSVADDVASIYPPNDEARS